jgi:hypothetical protein
MRRHGSKGQVRMDPTGGATTVPIGSLNHWSLKMDRDKADVTCFGDTVKQWVLGLPNIEGDLGGVWDSELSPALIRIGLGEVPVMLELVPSTADPTHMFTGLAYLQTGIDCPSDGAVTITGGFVGAGDWTLEPAAATTARQGDGVTPRFPERPAA